MFDGRMDKTIAEKAIAEKAIADRGLLDGATVTGGKEELELESPRDEARARERQSVGAKVVYEAIRLEGEEELDRSVPALFWSGLAAGLAMGLSLMASGVLRAALPDAPWRILLEGLGYTVGFLFVVMGRQQLFTENTLTPVIPLLSDWSRLRDVAVLWGTVLVANLIGAFLFALVAATTALFEPEHHRAFTAISQEALRPDAATLFVRAIAAGWLLALMVWLLPGAETARLAVVVIATYLIAVARLSHSIAGSVDAFYLILTGGAPWSEYGRFFVPTLLGNIVGGVLLVAFLNHLQVAGGPRRSEELRRK